MSKALYRKYRSKTFDEIVGQEHITTVLSNAIASGHVSHAYLLTGPRGVGKTSVARIMAHIINKTEYDETKADLDIIEIDAASNNGVDAVRDLREKAQIAPVAADKKVYIIDEVHMLSNSAFNALLKTLEEPPEHVVFILATTNIEKIPATITSRAQRFTFRPIILKDIVKQLKTISKQENIKIDNDALETIAKRGEGSLRDSISVLDQVSSLGDEKSTITTCDVENMLGLASSDTINQILQNIEKKDLSALVALLNQAFQDGLSATLLAKQLTNTIYEQIAEKPFLLPLLDKLIDVEKSPQPDLKLLSILGLSIADKDDVKTTTAHSLKSAALLAPVHEISASIEDLKKPKLQKPQKTIKKTAKTTKKSEKLDWNKFLDYVKKHQVALYSVLEKCGHELNDDTLTLYTNNKFYKKKLDDTRHSVLISECLQAVGVFGLNIHTIPTSFTPDDKQLATITAIMGGGEKISLD